jgi:NADH:ubiquinone oxidoreductase subunit 3 (subunit A)
MALSRHLFATVTAAAFVIAPALAESPAVDAMKEYMEFATYEAGIIATPKANRTPEGSRPSSVI